MKKIAVDTMKSFLEEHETENIASKSFQVGDGIFEVKIKTLLTLTEKSTFINRVLSGCFDAEDNFHPENVSPMLRATILQICTNLPVLTMKGVKTDDGKPTMDMDAMNQLYLAMDFDHFQDVGYQAMMGEMVCLCNQAIDWKKSRVLTAPIAESSAIHALGEAALAIHDVADTVARKVADIDCKELLQFAGELSEKTKGMDGAGLVDGLMKLHELREANKKK